MKAKGLTFGNTGEPHFVLLNPSNGYEITRFQRAYTWGDRQVQGVIEDLQFIEEFDESVGWPSIILQEREENEGEHRANYYDIGDGQQRIVTVVIALLAIWQKGHELPKDSNKPFEALFLDELIPSRDATNKQGLIANWVFGKNRRLELDPIVKFQAGPANIAFKRLHTVLDDINWDEIDKAQGLDKESKDAPILIYRAFKQFYDFFEENLNSFGALERTMRSILERIQLTVLEYKAKENMQRAFSNTNTYGVALKSNELVKSEVYGIVKVKDRALAEDIAEFWTNNLETGIWKNSRGKVQLRESSDTNLDLCLQQSLASHFIGKDLDESEPLSVRYSKYLKDQGNYSLFFSELKKDIEVFQIVHEDYDSNTGSLKWELNYFYQIVGRSGGYSDALHVLMKLRRVLNDSDLIEALKLLEKYFFMIAFVHQKAYYQAFDSALSKNKNSPLRKSSFSVAELENYLEGLVLRKSQWVSQEKIEEAIKKSSYGDTYNALLAELFIWAENKRRGKQYDQVHSRRLNKEVRKNREHILPKRPRNVEFTPEELNDHQFLVGKIGNTLPLAAEDNFSANNKSVEEKIYHYKKDQASTAWGRYIADFLSEYSSEKGWTAKEIDDRTARLAKEFAPLLAPQNPNVIDIDSKFNSLLEDITPGTKLYWKDKTGKGWLEFELKADGTLSFDKEIINAVKRLNEIIGKASNGGSFKDRAHLFVNGDYVLFLDHMAYLADNEEDDLEA